MPGAESVKKDTHDCSARVDVPYSGSQGVRTLGGVRVINRCEGAVGIANIAMRYGVPAAASLPAQKQGTDEHM